MLLILPIALVHPHAESIECACSCYPASKSTPKPRTIATARYC